MYPNRADFEEPESDPLDPHHSNPVPRGCPRPRKALGISWASPCGPPPIEARSIERRLGGGGEGDEVKEESEDTKETYESATYCLDMLGIVGHISCIFLPYCSLLFQLGKLKSIKRRGVHQSFWRNSFDQRSKELF